MAKNKPVSELFEVPPTALAAITKTPAEFIVVDGWIVRSSEYYAPAAEVGDGQE